MRTSCCLTLLVIAGALGGVAMRPAAAGDAPDRVTDAERDDAIARALRYLEKTTLGLAEAQGTPRKPFDVAAAGYVHLIARQIRGTRTEDRGGFLDKCRRRLLAYVEEVERRSRDPKELPSKHGLATSEALVQYTWPLAMAAIFFAELHAQGIGAAEAEKALQRIATLLGEAQDANGGWGHGRIAPRPDGAAAPAPGSPLDRIERIAGGYPSTLLASSVLVAASLGIVRRTLGEVEGPDLDTARRYFVDAQLRNGNFPYDPSQRQAGRDATGAGRTAGSLFALWTLGVPLDDRTIQRAAAYLDDHPGDVAEGHGSAVLTLLYGALAAKVRGERAWGAFRERFFRPILDAQSEQGVFTCIAEGKLFGTTNDSHPMGGRAPGGVFQAPVDVYVTALHTWILLLDAGTPKTLAPGPATTRPDGAVTPR